MAGAFSVNSSGAERLDVVPVWWDRERKKISFGGRAFTPAIMLFNRENLSVVTPEQVICELRVAQISTKWLGKYCCELIIDQKVYRIYFALPNTLVRRLDKSAVDRIGGVTSNASKTGGALSHILASGAVIGDYAAILGIIGKSLAFYRTMSDLKTAKESTARFKEVLA
jgi:hypothetical protein